MRLSPVETQAFDAIKELEVIDAHEHLAPEPHRVQRRVDFSTLLAHYTRADFISAGMQTEIYQRMINEETMPVEEKWAAFQALLHDGAAAGDMLHFTSLVYDRCFAFARKHDRTVAVHSGVCGSF